MNSPPRILVAGIGNIFLGDDGFGVEVAQQLLRRPRAQDVRVEDFGIRGIDLVYALLDGCRAALFIDACPRGQGPPGTLYVLAPQLDEPELGPPVMEAHSMDPMKALRAAAAMGACLKQVLILGCEPGPTANFDEGETPMGLSPPVQAAVSEAAAMVEPLVAKLREQLSPDDPARARPLPLPLALPLSQ